MILMRRIKITTASHIKNLVSGRPLTSNNLYELILVGHVLHAGSNILANDSTFIPGSIR